MDRKLLGIIIGALAAGGAGYSVNRYLKSRTKKDAVEPAEPEIEIPETDDVRLEYEQCGKCGKPVKEYEPFCPYCGHASDEGGE